MLNNYITKITGPLQTWVIHLHFYAVIQGIYSLFDCQNLRIFPFEMSFYQNPIIYCNMAIYCNTLKHNKQYGIVPYCFTPNTCTNIGVAILIAPICQVPTRLSLVDTHTDYSMVCIRYIKQSTKWCYFKACSYLF